MSVDTAVASAFPPPDQKPVASLQCQHQHHHAMKSPEDWFQVLESDERDAQQKPLEVIQAVLLTAGASEVTVAVIGSGTGYFAKRFARHAQVRKVVGTDIEDELVEFARKRVAEYLAPAGAEDGNSHHAADVDLRVTPPDDPQLEPEAYDIVFVCDVARHIEDRPVYWPKVEAALRPGGLLVSIDWGVPAAPDAQPDGGPPLPLRIPEECFVREIESSTSMKLAETHDFLPRQYFLCFAKPGLT